MSFDYTAVRRRVFIALKPRIRTLFFLQETLNEFESVPDRGPVVPREQSGEIWIVKSGAVIWEIGEFFIVARVNLSTKTTLKPVASFEVQNLNTKYTFLRL